MGFSEFAKQLEKYKSNLRTAGTNASHDLRRAFFIDFLKENIAANFREKMQEVFDALGEIHPDHFFSEGRVYGGGLRKMEPAELMQLPADRLAEILNVKREQQQTLF